MTDVKARGKTATLYDPNTVLLSGYAKQSSLSRITALTIGLFLAPSNTFSIGVGRSLKVDTVAWGRHKDGLTSNLKTFRDADRLRFIFDYHSPGQGDFCT
jgi:hypothetical protein